MSAAAATEPDGGGSGRNLRRAASAAMIAVAIIAGAFAQAVSAGLSPIDQDLFIEGSISLTLLSIAAHLALAAAVPVCRWPRQVLLFGAALAAMHWLLAAFFAIGAALPALGWMLYCGLARPGGRDGWRRWAAKPPVPVALVIGICGTLAAIGWW